MQPPVGKHHHRRDQIFAAVVCRRKGSWGGHPAEDKLFCADLTGGNVLLARDEKAPGGLVARVSDFGLARDFNVHTRIETAMYGTLTHMAPELISKGQASKVRRPFQLRCTYRHPRQETHVAADVMPKRHRMVLGVVSACRW